MFSGLMLNTWIAASIVAVIAGVTGFFAVLRGQSFAAHAIPNGAFAGAAGAGLLGLNVIWGLAVFAIEPGTGRLKLVEYEPTGGKTPRNFAIDPTGSYVLAENMASDTIVVFRVDAETGALEPTGQVVGVSRPCCVKFVPIPR